MIDSDRLHALRLQRGLTQMALAVRAGVSLSTITKFEQGRAARPGHLVVARIAQALGVDAGDIINDHASPPAQSGAPVQCAGEQCDGEPPEAA